MTCMTVGDRCRLYTSYRVLLLAIVQLMPGETNNNNNNYNININYYYYISINSLPQFPMRFLQNKTLKNYVILKARSHTPHTRTRVRVARGACGGLRLGVRTLFLFFYQLFYS